MKGLLEKIVSTKSSSMDLLSSEDRSFIEKQEALLAKLTSQLNAWKVIMDKGAADLPSSPLVHLNKEWGNWRASKNVFHDSSAIKRWSGLMPVCFPLLMPKPTLMKCLNSLPTVW
jgi:hypothetical protein